MRTPRKADRFCGPATTWIVEIHYTMRSLEVFLRKIVLDHWLIHQLDISSSLWLFS